MTDVKTAQVNHPDHRHDYNKPISDTTIANYVRNIKVFLNFMYQEREITIDIASKIESIKPKRKMKTLLSQEDIDKVLRAFDTTTFHGYRDWMITRLLLDTGMRVGECLMLKQEDIDFKHKAILIQNPKNKVQRYVYFSTKTGRHLKSWLLYRDRYSDSVHLFPTIRGTALQVRNYDKTLKMTGNKVGVSIHPHQLRNNFAKYYLLNNGDWFSLSRILGHSSAEVTQRAYLDFTNEEIGKKYQKHSPIDFLNL